MNLAQIFSSYIFYLSIILVALVCYIATRQYIKPGFTDIVSIVELLIGLSMFQKLLLVLAAIPFVGSFCDEWNDGYIGNVVLRCGVKKYARAKIWSCALSSFLTMFLGITLYVLILSIKYKLFNYIDYKSDVYADLINISPLMYTYTNITIFSLGMSVWCVLGMVVSVYIPNKFVALSSPIILSYLLTEVTNKFPGFINMHSLVTLNLNLNKGMLINFTYNIGILIFLIILLALLFRRIVGRRVSNELI